MAIHVPNILGEGHLANTADTETVVNPELTKAQQTIKELRAELSSAEQQFAAAGDLVARLFAEEKRQRILAAADRWPQLSTSSVAIVAGDHLIVGDGVGDIGGRNPTVHLHGPADMPMRWAATPDVDPKGLIDTSTIADTIWWLASLPRGTTTSEFVLKSVHIEL